MTTLDREYEDVVRRALIAAAESIEPAGDGLQRIRHRLGSPRSVYSVAASFTGWLRLSGIRFSVRLEPATETGRTALGQVRHLFTGPGRPPAPFLTRDLPPAEEAPGRRRPGRRGGALGRLGPAAAWLRPVLAVAAVVVVAAGAVLALNRSPQTLFRPTNSVSANHPAAAGQLAGGTAETSSLRPWEPLGLKPKPAATAGASSQHSLATMLPAVACSPVPSPSPSKPAATASATPSPTATPTESTQSTPTPTPTPTPTVTPTPTGTGGSSGSGAGTATQATTAAFVVPDAALQAASTSCGAVSAKAAPKSSPAAQ